MYTREQIQKIRELINSHFEKGDVYDKLKRKIESDNLSIEALDNETLQKILAETNLIDNLMLDIKHLDEIATFNYKNKRNEFVDPDKINYRSISLRIYKGKAFLEFIREDLNKEKYFQLFLSFCGQRFLSNKIPVNVDPEFNELFLFDLRTEN